MIKKITITSLSLIILVLLILPLKTYATSSGTIYLSPSSLNQEINSTFTVQLMINPGTSVNAVQANVNYNPADLQYVSNSISGGAFPTCVQDSPQSTDVVFGCTILAGSVSSNALIATITFKAINVSDTGLTLSNANAASDGTYTNPTALNSSVSIYPTPTPAPAPTQNNQSQNNNYSYSTTNQSSTSSTTTTATTPPATTAHQPSSPTKFKIQLSKLNINANQASLMINSSNNLDLSVKYGLSSNDLNQQTTAVKSTGQNMINLNNLDPHTNYFYQIFGSYNNQVSDTAVQEFQTEGLNITITVLTNKFKPITDQTFYLNNLSNKATSNQNGQLVFYDQSPGTNQLIYFINHKKYSHSIYIPALYVNHNLQPQSTIITLQNYHLDSLNQSDLASLATILIFIIGISARLIIGHKHRHLPIQ